MLASLAFVANGIVDASPVPAYRHLLIRQGRVYSCNGFVTYSAPIALDLDVIVPGALLAATLKACKEAPRLTLSSDRGRLTIDSGTLSVQLDCLTEPVTVPFPQGLRVDLLHDIRPALRRVLPFVSTDTSKRWACGAKLTGGRLLATNNVALAEVALPLPLAGEAVIPRPFIEAVLRVKAAPVAIMIGQASVSIWYPSGAWITGRTYPDQWPKVEAMLPTSPTAAPVPPGFFAALDTLAALPSGQDDLAIDSGCVTLLKANGVTAAIQVQGLPPVASRWSLAQLRGLRELATNIDLAAYPAPAAFYGAGVRGAIAGKG